MPTLSPTRRRWRHCSMSTPVGQAADRRRQLLSPVCRWTNRRLSAPRPPIHALWTSCCCSCAGPTLLPVRRLDLVRMLVPRGRCQSDRTAQPGLLLGSRRTRIWVPRDEGGLQRFHPPRRRHSAEHSWRAGPETRAGGPITLKFFEAAPIRCYYICRNTLYFTIYELTDGPLAKFRELFRVLATRGRSTPSGIAWQTALFTLNFALRPLGHGAQVRACLRGVWHGLTGNIAARY